MNRPAVASTIDVQNNFKEVQALIAKYSEMTNVPGVVVAICSSKLSGDAGLVIPYGIADLASKAPVLPSTVFELGSVTKVFTSLLTACAIVNPPSGRTPNLTDPVLDYLKAYGVQGAPPFANITLGQLATHTSGMPDEGPLSASKELFVDQAPSVSLTKYWNSYSGPPPPGCWRYSNIGFVTLGFAVSQLFSPNREPVPNTYNQLLKTLVTGPLNMTCTSANPAGSGCLSIASGYQTADNHPAPSQAFDLKSTGEDMLTFLKANLESICVPDSLAAAIRLTQTPQDTFPVCGESSSMKMGLGWQMPTVQQHQMFYKNGASSLGGFSCAVEFLPEEHLGIAVLTNQFPNKTAGVNPSTLAGWIRNLMIPGLAEAAQPSQATGDERDSA